MRFRKKRRPMKNANAQKGTEKWAVKSYAHDRPTDQAINTTKIQTRLLLGHNIGIVRRPMSLSPFSSRKSWVWIVEKMIRALVRKDIVVGIDIVDWPDAKGMRPLVEYGRGLHERYVGRTSCD